MKAKNFIIILFAIVLSIVLLPALVVLYVDPIQLYHNQVSLKKMKYFKEQRHQNIGFVNKFLKRGNEYDTIILGTSMSENFRSSKFEKYLNGTKVLKLTMSGGRPLEQYTLAKKALDTGKVKKVIWDIHTYYIYSKIGQVDKNHDFPYKLYSDNVFKQGFYYLFNKDYFDKSLSVYSGKVNWSEWTEDIDKLNYWMDRDVKKKKFIKYNKKENIKKLNAKISNRKMSFENIFNVSYKFNNIDKYILNLIKKYPDIEFNIYFPPYSTWFYRTCKINDYKRFLQARKYLVEKTKNMKNVKIYAFDNNYDIVNNIYNYKDYGHYRNYINDYIMDSIFSNKHIINQKNIDIYLNNMINNINSYNQVYTRKLEK